MTIPTHSISNDPDAKLPASVPVYAIKDKEPVFPCWLRSTIVRPYANQPYGWEKHYMHPGVVLGDHFSHWSPDASTPPASAPDSPSANSERSPATPVNAPDAYAELRTWAEPDGDNDELADVRSQVRALLRRIAGNKPSNDGGKPSVSPKPAANAGDAAHGLPESSGNRQPISDNCQAVPVPGWCVEASKELKSTYSFALEIPDAIPSEYPPDYREATVDEVARIIARHAPDARQDRGSGELKEFSDREAVALYTVMECFKERKALQADARRYRHLRDNWDKWTGTTWHRGDIPRKLDAALDAATKEPTA